MPSDETPPPPFIGLKGGRAASTEGLCGLSHPTMHASLNALFLLFCGATKPSDAIYRSEAWLAAENGAAGDDFRRSPWAVETTRFCPVPSFDASSLIQPGIGPSHMQL